MALNLINYYSTASVTGRGKLSRQLGKSRDNHLKQQIGVPYRSVYMNKIKVLDERYDKCCHDNASRESMIFCKIFYCNMIRKEYAYKKMRSALVSLSQSKLYRQDIKVLCKRIQAKIAKWDSDIARVVKEDSTLEFYDDMAEYGSSILEPYYTPFHDAVLDVLNKAGFKESEVLAAVECSSTLCEFATKQLTCDIGAYTYECPPVESLSAMVEDDVYKLFDDLRDILEKRLLGEYEIDLNKDESTKTSGDKLIDFLADSEQIAKIYNDFLKLNEGKEQ